MKTHCLHSWSDGRGLEWNNPKHSGRTCDKCFVSLLEHIEFIYKKFSLNTKPFIIGKDLIDNQIGSTKA